MEEMDVVKKEKKTDEQEEKDGKKTGSGRRGSIKVLKGRCISIQDLYNLSVGL